MKKKDQTKKTSKGISFKTQPATSQEKEELGAIMANKKYWQRPHLKKKFVSAHNRIPAEVNALIKGGIAVVEAGETFRRASKNAPRQNEPAPKTTELRVGIKNLRIEGGTLVIEIEK